MKQRIISGVVIAVIIVVLALTGGVPLAAVLMVCALIGYHELERACGVEKPKGLSGLEIISMLMIIVLYGGLMVISLVSPDTQTMLVRSDFFMLVCIVLDFLLTMTLYVLTFPKFKSTQVMTSIFSFLYCPVLMTFIFRARTLPHGIYIYALIFICSSVCDVCALAFGMAFGKHKMAPVLSPKKTVEGGIGGVLGSVVAAWICSLVLHMHNPSEDLMLEFILIGFVGAIVSMIGDLAASAIKRNHNIKDYGKLIPGHGGIMDRFDSIIFCAPGIYFLGVLLIQHAG